MCGEGHHTVRATRTFSLQEDDTGMTLLLALWGIISRGIGLKDVMKMNSVLLLALPQLWSTTKTFKPLGGQ